MQDATLSWMCLQQPRDAAQSAPIRQQAYPGSKNPKTGGIYPLWQKSIFPDGSPKFPRPAHRSVLQRATAFGQRGQPGAHLSTGRNANNVFLVRALVNHIRVLKAHGDTSCPIYLVQKFWCSLVPWFENAALAEGGRLQLMTRNAYSRATVKVP